MHGRTRKATGTAWAQAGGHRWLASASRCQLGQVVTAARMIRLHHSGIVNAIIPRATNGPEEGIIHAEERRGHAGASQD